MRPPAPRPELIRAWHRSDDHSAASGGSRVKARAGCAGGFARLDALAPRCSSPTIGSTPRIAPATRGRRTGVSAASAQSRVPLRRKRPAGTQGDGDIDEPSVVTGRARSLDHHAASEIDAPGPCLTPTCGGRTRRPRTEEWPLPDDHPRSRCQLGALDPRSPITEEGSTTASGSRAGLAARPAEAGFDLAGHSRESRGTKGPNPNTAGHRRPRAPCKAEGAAGFLPGRDRIVDRHAFVYRSRRIGKPAEEEQRCPLERAGPGPDGVSPCSSASMTSCPARS